MTKKSKIPTIIALFLLVAGIISGVLLVNSNQVFKLKANPNSIPQNVHITNISDASFTISWTTLEQTSGVVKWGKTDSNLNQPVNDELPSPGFIHQVSIKLLSPQTTYYFKIYAGNQEYDNNGIPWEATTGSTRGEPNTINIISGTVLTPTGKPVINALVYITVGGGLFSTPTSQNGSWLMPISNSNDLLEISVDAGPDGVATAQAYPQAANPLPPLILGQVHDFRNLPPNQIGEIPNAQINLPVDNTSTISGFIVGDTTPVKNITPVTLDSIEEGEIVTSENPEFFGRGPAGTAINIKIESENPITKQINISTNGAWKFSSPTNLVPGNHTVTITWKDAQGILRTLTKNFVISAAAGPAFVSTPSATLKATATPKPSATPQSTIIPTVVASPTAIPNIPVSGSLTPTILLFMMSIGVISLSIILWKKSEI